MGSCVIFVAAGPVQNFTMPNYMALLKPQNLLRTSLVNGSMRHGSTLPHLPLSGTPSVSRWPSSRPPHSPPQQNDHVHVLYVFNDSQGWKLWLCFSPDASKLWSGQMSSLDPSNQIISHYIHYSTTKLYNTPIIRLYSKV
jgi:hypothetical protein